MKRALPLLLVAMLAACDAKPLPPEKADYAGHWRGEGVNLIIERSGEIQYRKMEGKGQVQISGPVAQWIDDDFVVGVMVMKTKFDVSEPPHKVGEVWSMTVDGVQLLRDEP